jgi:hypothetical protein
MASVTAPISLLSPITFITTTATATATGHDHAHVHDHLPLISRLSPLDVRAANGTPILSASSLLLLT